MFSTEHPMSFTMKKTPCYLSTHQEENVPLIDQQKTFFNLQTFSKIINKNYLQNMLLKHNKQLSVTVVNDEILGSSFLKNLSIRTKDLSCKEKNLIQDLKQEYSKDYIKSTLPVSTLKYRPNIDMQDWHIVNNFNSIKIRNDVNHLKNMNNAYGNNSTMESQSMLQNVNKIEKIIEDIADASGSRKHNIDTLKDVDVESFFMVSHSDVPTNLTDTLHENLGSCISTACRNVWNCLANQFYCKIESAKMPTKFPLQLTKQRKKVNSIAMGRGRGRAKCQLRRSGVSQTIRRKKCIKDNDELWQNNHVSTALNDYPLRSKFDSSDDLATCIKRDNSSMHSFSKETSMKRKTKMRKKKRTIARCVKSTKMSKCENSNTEIRDTPEDLSRMQAETTIDIEDDWIVFENEELPETREKRGATEYPIRTQFISNSSIKIHDSSYENSDDEVSEKLLRLRLSLESSTESESDDHNSTNLDEQETTECSSMPNHLMKNKYRKDYQIQKDLFQHRRLLSDSSETSDDSNILDISDTSNTLFTAEEDNDEYSQDDFIIFADEELRRDTKKKVSFELTPVIHTMCAWNYAYRAARKGPWEEIARDTERFRGRINSIAKVLDPVLNNTHRLNIWQERFAEIF